MTLQDFITERKMLVCEYEKFRARVAHPDYRLSWTGEQWKNRMSGRTQLKDSEIFLLGCILDEIRLESKKEAQQQ